ncbi:MAG TPA: metal-sulfur cluster assembly factor [Candidatus Baltobacteraceae bacterium]|nr:metal-sulfur cluster assembly factor [Candidatus Baltobacteraceae bacterium]
MTESTRGREILDRLNQVIDPELGIGLVSLGLIYRLRIDDDDSVHVWMTLTTPGCPMHETITKDVDAMLRSIPWVSGAGVHLVFDPPWTTERLTDEARRELGRV